MPSVFKGSKYCINHNRIYGTKEEKKKVPVKKISDKRKRESREYRKIVKEKIGSLGVCKVVSPECTYIATGLHHLQKRSPANYKDPENLIPCCNPCNLYIEINPVWAKENGFTISRFKKKEHGL